MKNNAYLCVCRWYKLHNLYVLKLILLWESIFVL